MMTKICIKRRRAAEGAVVMNHSDNFFVFDLIKIKLHWTRRLTIAVSVRKWSHAGINMNMKSNVQVPLAAKEVETHGQRLE